MQFELVTWYIFISRTHHFISFQSFIWLSLREPNDEGQGLVKCDYADDFNWLSQRKGHYWSTQYIFFVLFALQWPLYRYLGSIIENMHAIFCLNISRRFILLLIPFFIAQEFIRIKFFLGCSHTSTDISIVLYVSNAHDQDCPVHKPSSLCIVCHKIQSISWFRMWFRCMVYASTSWLVNIFFRNALRNKKRRFVSNISYSVFKPVIIFEFSTEEIRFLKINSPFNFHTLDAFISLARMDLVFYNFCLKPKFVPQRQWSEVSVQIGSKCSLYISRSFICSMLILKSPTMDAYVFPIGGLRFWEMIRQWNYCCSRHWYCVALVDVANGKGLTQAVTLPVYELTSGSRRIFFVLQGYV